MTFQKVMETVCTTLKNTSNCDFHLHMHTVICLRVSNDKNINVSIILILRPGLIPTSFSWSLIFPAQTPYTKVHCGVDNINQ